MVKRTVKFKYEIDLIKNSRDVPINRLITDHSDNAEN